MRCPHCGQEHPDGTVFCPTTGRKLSEALFCTNCGAAIQPTWKACPRCGTPVTQRAALASTAGRARTGAKAKSPDRPSRPVKRSRTLIVVGSAIAIFLALAGSYFYFNRLYHPSLASTLPSPLKDVEFSTAQASYPTDWPSDLAWPKDFKLVDSAAGTLPGSTSKGWSAKLRYSGGPSAALQATSAFLEARGWKIVESNHLDSGAISVLLERSQGSGIVVMDADPNDSSQTVIIATFFP